MILMPVMIGFPQRQVRFHDVPNRPLRSVRVMTLGAFPIVPVRSVP